MPENAASKYLRDHNETVEDWDGICGELANAISIDDDDILHVEGDILWRFHMVVLRAGMVHDAWCEGDALPPRDWLINMFGPETYVEVALNGDDIFYGESKDFNEALLKVETIAA